MEFETTLDAGTVAQIDNLNEAETNILRKVQSIGDLIAGLRTEAFVWETK